VEAATAIVITPETLRERADECERKADELRERSRIERVEAMRLRREADALENARRLTPVPTAGGGGGSTDARAELATAIAAWLVRCRKPKSSTEIAEHFGAPISRTRGALDLLVEKEIVIRSGLKRGTRYRLRREGEVETQPQPFGQRYHEVVRDTAVRLGTFTFAEIWAELPDLAEPSLRRWLNRLVDDGVLSVERVGTSNLYAYEDAPNTSPTHKPRGEIIPTVVPRSRGSVVEGNGARRIARREVRELVEAAQAQGADIRLQKHGYAIVVNGETITSVPRTPSDHRSLKNVRAELKRAGLNA
jgi:DNA-binding transcriptional ArsR family regulator